MALPCSNPIIQNLRNVVNSCRRKKIVQERHLTDSTCHGQILSGFLRPKKDAKVRIYWNVFHHVIGFATIIIIIVNIFEGIHVLQPDSKWKKIYIIVIAILAAISLVMEIITWIVWFRRRQVSPKRLDHPNGVNRAGPPEEYKFDHV